MPVPTAGKMADSPSRRSLSPRRGKLERVNAHKRISYRAPEIDTMLRDRDSLREDEMMLYGRENVDEVNHLFKMLGEPWGISPEDWKTRKSRNFSSISSSPSLSPALASPDSGKFFPHSPDFTFAPACTPDKCRESDRHGAQTWETLVPSTSYSSVSLSTKRGGLRSGELNPSWMTEGKAQDSGTEVDRPPCVGSPQTPRSRVGWMSETLPDKEDTAPVPGLLVDSFPSRREFRLQPSISAPVLKSNSPGSRPSEVREISLSPPRDYSSYSRTISAPRESVEELLNLNHKGSQVQKNDQMPQESTVHIPARDASDVKGHISLDTSDAGTGGQKSSMHVRAGAATPVTPHITVNTVDAGRGSSDQSGNESLTTDDGDSSSAGLEDDAVLSPSPSVGALPWRSWKKLQRLGAGSFGTVYGGVSNNSTYFAVKEVPLNSESEQSVTQLEQEIALLSRFQHENIVQYLGTERTEDTLYIFLELVTMGSLASLYNKHELFLEQIQNYTRQILYGLKYLHDKEIVHRDVKCANILVSTNGTAKLADFGMAKQISKFEEVKSTKGSAQWMAPEVINPRQRYHLPADIWSLGCTVLEMAIRGPPFGELEWGRVFWKVAHGEAPTIPDDLDEDMKDFIRHCLEVNPSNRPTATELLQHPFVNGQHSPTSSFRAPMGSSLQVITEENSGEARSDNDQ